MRVRTRVGAFAVVVGLVCAGVPGGAVAHDHRPPVARLRAGTGGAQRAEWIWFTWAHRIDADTCGGVSGDSLEHYPDPLVVPPGERRARVIFWKQDKPRKVKAWYWTQADEDGHVTGDGTRIDLTLKQRRRRSGKVSWVAAFTADVLTDYYIQMIAVWKDRHGCGIQDILYTFRMSAIPES